MKVLKHLLFLVTVIITGRADVIPEPPAEGFGFGNQFKTATQASASVEVHAGETAENGETVQADATAQTKLQAQFGQEAQDGAETQADAIIEETQGNQYYEGTNIPNYQTEKPFYSIMPYYQLSHLPGPDLSYNYHNLVHPAHQYAHFPPTNWNPYVKPVIPESLVQAEGEINSENLNKYNGSVLYDKTDNGIYNGGYIREEALKAHMQSHLQSGVQFGEPVGAEAVAQTGSVVESRFGQNTPPPRRPMQGFGYRHPYNRNRG